MCLAGLPTVTQDICATVQPPQQTRGLLPCPPNCPSSAPQTQNQPPPPPQTALLPTPPHTHAHTQHAISGHNHMLPQVREPHAQKQKYKFLLFPSGTLPHSGFFLLNVFSLLCSLSLQPVASLQPSAQAVSYSNPSCPQVILPVSPSQQYNMVLLYCSQYCTSSFTSRSQPAFDLGLSLEFVKGRSGLNHVASFVISFKMHSLSLSFSFFREMS